MCVQLYVQAVSLSLPPQCLQEKPSAEFFAQSGKETSFCGKGLNLKVLEFNSENPLIFSAKEVWKGGKLLWNVSRPEGS